MSSSAEKKYGPWVWFTCLILAFGVPVFIHTATVLKKESISFSAAAASQNNNTTASAPYGISPEGYAYCGPSDKESGKWDDLRNYGNGSIEGGCIVPPKKTPYGISPEGYAYCGPSNKTPGTWDDLRNYGDRSVEGGCVIAPKKTPYGISPEGYAYCGPSNKAPGTWDDLRNYGNGSIEGGCIVPPRDNEEHELEDLSNKSLGVAPYGRSPEGHPYCGPSDKESGSWDDLRNYGDQSIEGGCIVPPRDNEEHKLEDLSSQVLGSAPYGRSPEGYAYCGPSDKDPGKWDDLRNYGDRSIEGGCIVPPKDTSRANTTERVALGNESLPEGLRGQYEPVFYDEFNAGYLDPKKWNTEFLWGPNVTINKEEQYYASVFGRDHDLGITPFNFKDGSLVITAQKTPSSVKGRTNGKEYISGIITSYDSFKFTHGYAEARVKVPKGQGLWPAFWLLNAYYVDGKKKPEIDIMEFLGHQTTRAYQTYHYFDPSGKLISNESHNDRSAYTDDYHVFAAQWEPGLIQFYIDGEPTKRIEGPGVASEEMYILANLAVGGSWPGTPNAATKFPAEYALDWIRVYQKK